MSTDTPRLPTSGGSYRDDGKTLSRITEPTTPDPGKTARMHKAKSATAPTTRRKRNAGNATAEAPAPDAPGDTDTAANGEA